MAQWINIHPQDGVGDERGFARLVAARLGVELTEASKPEVAFDREAVLALSKGARPGVNGMDPDYDAELASRARASGAWAIMTGQGGDEIFFASRCPAIAAEIRPGAGWLALADPRMHGLARWTRTSVWSLMRTRRRTLRPEAFASPLTGTQASRLGGPSLSHPWLADLNGLAPAKREQIGFLARSLLHHGECLRGSAARLVHGPLLQPTVELCLALPASVLTLCLRDRALVRRAFADRLPSEIVHRRGKGDLNAYYGRMLARSLWWIRPFLLEGVLAVRGLIDRNVLDDRLHPDDMAWRGEVADLMDLMAIEAWARTWSSRTPSSLGPLTP